MNVIITRDQFIAAHLNYVDRGRYILSFDMQSIEKTIFERLNNLFLFDIKHVELSYVDFSHVAKYWPKKKN